MIRILLFSLFGFTFNVQASDEHYTLCQLAVGKGAAERLDITGVKNGKCPKGQRAVFVAKHGFVVKQRTQTRKEVRHLVAQNTILIQNEIRTLKNQIPSHITNGLVEKVTAQLLTDEFVNAIVEKMIQKLEEKEANRSARPLP